LLHDPDSGASQPSLKICDFGYSKSSILHSAAKTTVGTPAYLAPEVLRRMPYSGQTADVWSCGVTLYVMLVGKYPFEDERDPRNFRLTMAKILSRSYDFPRGLALSAELLSLLDGIFRVDPGERLTVQQISLHPWVTAGGGCPSYAEMVQGLPEAADGERLQSVDDILRLVKEAQAAPQGEGEGAAPAGGSGDSFEVADDLMEDAGGSADYD